MLNKNNEDKKGKWLVGKFKDNDGFASYSASFIPSIWKKEKKNPSNIKNGEKKSKIK
jgi:hypothetical protein